MIDPLNKMCSNCGGCDEEDRRCEAYKIIKSELLHKEYLVSACNEMYDRNVMLQTILEAHRK